MKKVVRFFCSIFTLVCICIPQIANSYDFESKAREEHVISTRNEIYDLYNLRKEVLNSNGTSSSNKFGFLGYNGACTTVTVNGTTIPLDDYIAGVIKQEMGGNNLEALKAQAIAARSFLLSTKANSSTCSVANGQSYQAYTKDSDSNSIYHQAASETSGLVVNRNGSIAHTQYMSYPAGQYQTEDSSGWHVKFQRFNDDPSTEWTWNGPSKKTVLAGYGGTELNYDNPHHWGMSQSIAHYLAEKENYTYEQIIELFYAQPIASISDGVYDSEIEYYDSSFGKIIYWSQRDFSSYYFSSDVTKLKYYGSKGNEATIATHGCGPTSVAIVVASMKNDESITPIVTTQKVCSINGGCDGSGSYSDALISTLKSYGLTVKTSNDDQEALDALNSNKSLVIVNMGPGMFTQGGHYMVLTGVNTKGEVSVADPGNREYTKQQWFDFNIIMEQRKQHSTAYIIVSK